MCKYSFFKDMSSLLSLLYSKVLSPTFCNRYGVVEFCSIIWHLLGKPLVFFVKYLGRDCKLVLNHIMTTIIHGQIIKICANLKICIFGIVWLEFKRMTVISTMLQIRRFEIHCFLNVILGVTKICISLVFWAWESIITGFMRSESCPFLILDWIIWRDKRISFTKIFSSWDLCFQSRILYFVGVPWRVH